MRKSTFWHRLVFFNFHDPPHYGGQLFDFFANSCFYVFGALLQFRPPLPTPRRDPKERPRPPQGGPRSPQGAPKEHPRAPQERPRAPKEPPRSTQELPRAPKEHPRAPKRPQRHPQDATRCLKRPPKAPQNHREPHFFRHTVAQRRFEPTLQERKKSKLDGKPTSIKRVQ